MFGNASCIFWYFWNIPNYHSIFIYLLYHERWLCCFLWGSRSKWTLHSVFWMNSMAWMVTRENTRPVKDPCRLSKEVMAFFQLTLFWCVVNNMASEKASVPWKSLFNNSIILSCFLIPPSSFPNNYYMWMPLVGNGSVESQFFTLNSCQDDIASKPYPLTQI